MNKPTAILLRNFALVTRSNYRRIKKNYLAMDGKQKSIAILEIKRRLQI